MRRRLITLSVAAVLVGLLLRLSAGEASEAEATFMLGFALLVAALAGEIVEQVGLPRITGYIVAGLLFSTLVSLFLVPVMYRLLGRGLKIEGSRQGEIVLQDRLQ